MLTARSRERALPSKPTALAPREWRATPDSGQAEPIPWLAESWHTRARYESSWFLPGGSDVDLSAGQVLVGKYRIERMLGRGGMGMVVAATHLQLGERVALKFLLPEAMSNPEAVERFSREARAAVRIKSEHVARVSDVGTLENGAPYMVMEYLDGQDLADWLVQRGPLPIEQGVEFVLQACEAIAEAHSLGIVHRDLKPANLFVIQRPDGVLSVKVLDFGISKASGIGSAGSMTSTSAVMGSPYYMSPEQMHSARDADARSDIWALGIVMHELFSGKYPFHANAISELVLKVALGVPTPLSVVLPGAPPGLEKVILKCLEKDRSQRYPSIDVLALALLEFAPRRSKTSVERISGIMQRAGMSATALELPPSSTATGAVALTGPSDRTQVSWSDTAAPEGKRRRVVGALVGSLAAVAALAAGYTRFHNRSPAAPSSAAVASPAQDRQPPAASAAVPQRSDIPSTAAPAAPAPSSAASVSTAAPAANKPALVNAPPPKPTLPVVRKPGGAASAQAQTPQPAPTPPAPPSPLKMKIE